MTDQRTGSGEVAMDCRRAQEVLGEWVVDPVMASHFRDCPSCAAGRRVSLVLRSSLVVDAPP